MSITPKTLQGKVEKAFYNHWFDGDINRLKSRMRIIAEEHGNQNVIKEIKGNLYILGWWAKRDIDEVIDDLK